MPARLHYPTQQPALPPGAKIKPDDSYFLLRLHDSHVIMQKTFRWGEAGTLLLKTLIQNDIHKQPVAGLHKIEQFRYNRVTRLAAQVELTDWLPAYGGDKLHLELQYILVRNDPLKQLLDKMADVDLTTKLTAVRWEVGLGTKVAEMFGRVFSYLLKEGQAEPIFDLQVDLNVDKLRPGFMVAADANYPGTIPAEFIITEREDLVLKNQYGYPLEDASYATFEILPRKRLGERYWRESGWGQILLEGRNEALRAQLRGEAEKRKALAEFVEVCYYAGRVAATDLRFIRRHVDEIASSLVREIEAQFFGQESFTVTSTEPLPETWQRAFNVQTEAQLDAAAMYYQQALADSEDWLAHYGIVED